MANTPLKDAVLFEPLMFPLQVPADVLHVPVTETAAKFEDSREPLQLPASVSTGAVGGFPDPHPAISSAATITSRRISAFL
jgi:hypothetical protein